MNPSNIENGPTPANGDRPTTPSQNNLSKRIGSKSITGIPTIALERDAIDWNDLGSKYGKMSQSRSRERWTRAATHRIKSCCESCSPFRYLASLFPFFVWIRSYSIKDNLVSDVVVGITIAILHIPQGMAYGMLAGLEPVYGLY